MKFSERINNLSLTSLNFYAFLLHLFSGIIIAIVLFAMSGDINFNTNLYAYKINTISSDGKTVTFDYGDNGAPELENSAVALKLVLVFIFLITAFFHFFYCSRLFGFNDLNKIYIDQVKSGKNSIRWIEYGITASMMIYIYCVISGVKDIFTVLLIVLFNIVLMSFGYFLEITDNRKGKLAAIIMGFFILLIIFSVSYYQFVGNLEAAKNDGFDIPEFVYAVVLAMVFWWISFGVVGVLYYKASLKGEVDFQRYEKYYIFLSFVSKAFMGYYIAFGLTRDAPDRDN